MITDKSRYGHDAVLDLNCGDSVQVLRTEPMTLTEQEQKIVQKYLGIALLERSYIDANGHLMVVLSDGRTLDVGSARGLPGATPYLGENGNWFVEGVDTLQSARGLPGFTPYIGENEHWWIDETDTGIPARGIPLTEKADNTRFLRNDGTWQKVTPENIGAAKQSDFAAQKSIVTDHTARIEALEQRTVTAPYYTDDSVAYVKDVPENALPFASVDMVGGMTRKCTNILPSGALTAWGCECSTESDGRIMYKRLGTGGVSFFDSEYFYLCANNTYSISVTATHFKQAYVIKEGCEATADGVLYGNIAYTPAESGRYYIRTYLLDEIEDGTTGHAYLWVNEGTEPLPYEPYFDGLRSAPVTEVKSMSANLVYQTKDVMEHNGVTFTKNADGSITMNGTSTAQAYNSISGAVALANGTYTLSVDGSSRDAFAYISFNDGTGATVSIGNRLTFTITDRKKISYLILNTNAGRTFSNDTYYIMVNRGSTALPYTPYREPVSLPIPAAVQALDGYGWGVNDKVYNYIDLEKKQFVKRVGCVDMGTLTWEKSTSVEGRFHAIVPGITVVGRDTNVISAKYDTSTKEENGTMFHGSDRVYIRDTSYTDAATFKSAMSGVMLYYELAEPVITDISDILPDDNLIRVEGGGTVTMANEYGYDVPSEITYARLTWQ